MSAASVHFIYTVNVEIFVHKIFCNKNFGVKMFGSLTSRRNYLYDEIFFTKKELVHARSIHLTTAEAYQLQFKQARGTCVVHVGCHTKQTTSMAKVYSNDAVVFEGTTCYKDT